MILFLAGNYGSKVEKGKMANLPANRLHTFLSEKAWIDRRNPKLKMMVDSGAHSWNKTFINRTGGAAPRTDLPPIQDYYEEYISYAAAHSDDNIIYVELDVYGTIEKVYLDSMYKIARKKIKNFIRVYHTILDDGSLSELKKWIREGQTYIGIGNDSTHLLPRIFDITRDKVKIHGFAMTKQRLLDRYPFYSVDSTSWKSVQMFGGAWVNGKKMRKEEIRELKHPAIFKDSRYSLYDGAVAFMKMEEYYTNLWKARGVNWHE